MVVFETNRPWVIDPAVLSRISRSIEFPNPAADDIASMLKTKVKNVLERKQTFVQRLFGLRGQIDYSLLKDEACIKNLASTFANEKFVGRDITNFVILLAQAAYACDMKITKKLLDEVGSYHSCPFVHLTLHRFQMNKSKRNEENWHCWEIFQQTQTKKYKKNKVIREEQASSDRTYPC